MYNIRNRTIPYLDYILPLGDILNNGPRVKFLLRNIHNIFFHNTITPNIPPNLYCS